MLQGSASHIFAFNIGILLDCKVLFCVFSCVKAKNKKNNNT